jgi:hypothetical protein
VKFWLIVAARPTNASEKLPAEPLGGLVAAPRALARSHRSALAAPPEAPKRHFFLAMKKKWPHSAEKSGK